MLRLLGKLNVDIVGKNSWGLHYFRRCFLNRSMSSKCTAGIIIIGDEITKGKVADTNSHYVAQKLYSLGVDVRKISVIPDEVDVIAEEVALFSKKFTHVVTAGGIGPTHDDITYQAIAHGLRERLILLPDLVALIKSHFKITVPDYDPLNPPTFPWDVETSSFDPALKMALVPASSRLHHANGVSVFPMVQVNNVYIMPGIPQYLKRCCRHLETLARNPDFAFLSNEIYVQTDEVRLAPILNAAVKQFGAHVSFGSYPVIGHSYYRTKLTMESSDQARLDAAYQYLSSELPADSIVSYDPMAIERAAEAIQDIIGGKGAHHHELQVPVSNAYQTIEECLSRYEPSEVCVSFNGGKDCSALLHLIHAAWTKRNKGSTTDGLRLRALYIRGQDPFPEMEQFIEDTRQRYNLELWTVPGPVRSGLKMALNEHPEIKAILMGTRRSDPHAANLQAFQMTDDGWPSVMRVSPILDWSYQQVWLLLRQLNLPYCNLYDKGYTSVGNRGNTQPNAALRVIDPATGLETYRPAYLLHDCMAERQGRL
ncbi:hypothetical protein GHT06_022287 [Daphnia sinensis]|uniref:FAD synthase n=1 Tax=Daphnia sinensis TaxID=1820382 RepID=A0AAD5KWV3_9CRUS|nr:hypothetical protein GHT06_022287 [Daphnia sinensis]